MPVTKTATFAAALAGMLAFTAPAHAAIVDVFFNNVKFSGGDVVYGDYIINESLAPSDAAFQGTVFDASINGQGYWGRVGIGPNLNTATTLTALYYTPGASPGGGFYETLSFNPADLPNLSAADFTLSRYIPGDTFPATYAVSGDVSCVSGCDAMATPLPDTLPMFATALIGFMGFAAWRSRRAA